jgi:hypothetical protein
MFLMASDFALYVRHSTYQTQAGYGLPESCPKIGDVPKSPFASVAALTPSAGTITANRAAVCAGATTIRRFGMSAVKERDAKTIQGWRYRAHCR